MANLVSTAHVIQDPLPIYVKYHSEHSKPIAAAHLGEWVDLKTAEDYSLKKDDFKILSLGVSIKLPAGYEAELAPRSSTFKKYGILQANSKGVIDQSYSGNNDIWGIPVFATRDIFIEAGTRIAQFRIWEIQPNIEIIEVDNLTDESRGGFGSTGD